MSKPKVTLTKRKIGHRLYNARSFSNMTMKEVAEKIGVRYSTVWGWENGISIPRVDNLIKLSRLYEVSIDYILKGGGL